MMQYWTKVLILSVMLSGFAWLSPKAYADERSTPHTHEQESNFDRERAFRQATRRAARAEERRLKREARQTQRSPSNSNTSSQSKNITTKRIYRSPGRSSNIGKRAWSR